MSELDLTPEDESLLAARGISLAEARRQLALLGHPPAKRRLVRPCTVGDGIVRIAESDVPHLLRLHDEAAASGGLAKFVPASGAATRMFRELSVVRARAGAPGDPESRALLAFVNRLEQFAFWSELRAELARRGLDAADLRRRGEYRALLDALLDEPGLAFAGRPKGLLPFHRYPSGSRTAFEEHLVEASALVRDADGVCRAWFTVAPEERARFVALWSAVRSTLEGELGARLEVTFSVQRPSTETLAADGEGRPFRDAKGALVLRPGGHGALIENLAELKAGIVQIKNINNIARDPLQRSGVHWKKILTGLVVRLRREAASRAGELAIPHAPPAIVEDARRFLAEQFGAAPADGAGDAAVLAALSRPIRACGVVRNQGEPGGGPFWVEDREGSVRPQIVEGAEVNAGSESQRSVFAAATHFNPVDMVCALGDEVGSRYDLRKFIDESAVIVTRKTWEGRELVALERPGLWNGAMAGWNTVFVEVPAETFTPVKSVLDLLRPEHLPPE